MELDEVRLVARVDEAEGMHAEALHHAIAARDGAVRHDPHEHVRRFGHQRHEIPERVVCGCGLWHAVMGLGLHGMYEVRKFHRILDEEHRNVVADEIPVAFIGVELHRESAHVARGVRRPTLAGDGGKTHENRSALARFVKDGRPRDLVERCITLEIPMSAGAARVYHALRNALVIEVRDLFAQDEVFEKCRTAQAHLERILVVRNGHALIGRERAITGVDANAIE